MGLGVVSRLAARYGIKAELLRNADSGITASLTLPRAILILPRVDSGIRQGYEVPLFYDPMLSKVSVWVPRASPNSASSSSARRPRHSRQGSPCSAPASRFLVRSHGFSIRCGPCLA